MKISLLHYLCVFSVFTLSIAASAQQPLPDHPKTVAEKLGCASSDDQSIALQLVALNRHVADDRRSGRTGAQPHQQADPCRREGRAAPRIEIRV